MCFSGLRQLYQSCGESHPSNSPPRHSQLPHL
jgi:hypothetical protein